MTSAALRHLLNRMLLLPVALLLLVAAVLLVAIWQMRETSDWVDHTDQVIAESNLLLRSVIDEETGLRGYLAMHDRLFLQPYQEADRALPQLFDELSHLVADNREQAERLDALRQQHDHWHQLASRDLQDPTLASTLDRGVERKREMDNFRRQMATFIAAEEALRATRVQRSHRALLWTLTLTLGLSAISGMFISFSVRRAIRRVSNAYAAQIDRVSEQRQWLDTTLRGIGDAVIACDAKGCVEFMNQIAVDCTGWPEADAVGKPLPTVFHIVNEQTREPAEDPVRKVLRLNHVVGLANHTLLIRRDGSEIQIDDSGAPIRDANGQIRGVVLVFRDVTEERQREHALVRSEKLATAGRLAATIAHELNNPLESAVNLLFLAKADPGLPEKTRSYLDLADGELRRVSHLARQSLGFYRDNSRAEPFKPAALIREILELHKLRVSSRKIEFQNTTEPSVVARANVGETRQILSNLIANSMDASTDHSAIRVRARDARHEGVIGTRYTVADSGSGIPPNILNKVFDPFFTTKADVGTGLGLWVVKTLVEKSGGTLRVRSRTSPPTGTVFSIFIPSVVAGESGRSSPDLVLNSPSAHAPA